LLNLININGQLVRSVAYSNIQTVTWEMDALSQGIYFMQVKTKMGRSLLKLVKN